VELRKVTVRQMPGVKKPFSVQPYSAHLNLLVGPNESGKTTLCRAIRAILWPGTETDEPISIESQWTEADETLTATREETSAIWRRDGKETPPPPLPDERFARCFTLGLGDLLLNNGSSTDAEIAAEIYHQMSGGYDLTAIEEQFAISPKNGQGERTIVRDLKERVADIQRAQRHRAREEDRLPAVYAERDRIQTSQAELDLLKRTRDLAEERQHLRRIRGALAEFPKEMGQLQGHEKRDLEQLKMDYAQFRSPLPDCEKAIQAARTVIQSCRLPHGPIGDGELSTWVERAGSLQRVEINAQEKRDEVTASQGALAESVQHLAPEHAPQGPLDRELLGDLEGFLLEAEAVRQERIRIDADRTYLQEGQEGKSKATLEWGMEVLRNWQARKAYSTGHKVIRNLSWLGAIALLLGLDLGWFAHWSGFVLSGVGIGMLGVIFLFERNRDLAAQQCQRQYGKLRLKPIFDWSLESVDSHLQQLEEEWKEAVEGERRATLLDELKAREERLVQEELQVDEKRAKLCLQLQVDPEGDLQLFLFANRILKWDEAREELAGLEAQLSRLEERVQEGLEDLNTFFKRQGEPEVEDAAAARGQLEDLKVRSAQFEKAREILERESARHDAVEAGIRKQKERIRRFWKKTGLQAGDQKALYQYLDWLDEYRNLVNEGNHRKQNIREYEKKLKSRQDLLELTFEEADGRVRTCQQSVEKLGDVMGEIGSIKASIQHAGQKEGLEQALADLSEGEQLLEERRQENLHKVAGKFLLEGVRAQHDQQSCPKVLRCAAELFAKFTHHKYSLIVDERSDPPSFRVFEVFSQIRKSLLELSDGTRIQLLLAVRLAFAGQIERGIKLPIFLDDVLTTSDPSRFQAIVESLNVLAAEEERQIVYLTANPSDAVRWNQTLMKKGVEQEAPIDLGQIRGMAKMTSPEKVSGPASREIPSPEGRSADKYGALLQVPSLDFSHSVTSVHLFYLLRDDLGTLHALLKAPVETVGQWQALVNGGGHRMIGDHKVERLLARIDLMKAFSRNWRIGRRQKAEASVWAAAGMSDPKLESLSSLLEEMKGDIRRLLSVLREGRDSRTQHLTAADVKELENRLVKSGLIDNRPILSEDEIVVSVIPAVQNWVEQGVFSLEEVSRLTHEWYMETSH
jgi:energy-coupling factor transporter ATP-binding protein EcfA2